MPWSLDSRRNKETEKGASGKGRRWLDLVNNAAVGVFRASDKGEFLLANREMARIFGFDTPEGFLRIHAEHFHDLQEHRGRK